MPQLSGTQLSPHCRHFIGRMGIVGAQYSCICLLFDAFSGGSFIHLSCTSTTSHQNKWGIKTESSGTEACDGKGSRRTLTAAHCDPHNMDFFFSRGLEKSDTHSATQLHLTASFLYILLLEQWLQNIFPVIKKEEKKIDYFTKGLAVCKLSFKLRTSCDDKGRSCRPFLWFLGCLPVSHPELVLPQTMLSFNVLMCFNLTHTLRVSPAIAVVYIC